MGLIYIEVVFFHFLPQTQIVATAGYEVVAIESNPKVLVSGRQRIADSLSKIVARELKSGKISSVEEGEAKIADILSRIVFESDINAAR